jgi:hypothetical protein
MDLDSGVEIRSQPSTNPLLLDNVCNIILISLRILFLKCLSNNWLPSTDCCYILGWLTTTRNKRVSSCAFITSWAVSRTITVMCLNIFFQFRYQTLNKKLNLIFFVNKSFFLNTNFCFYTSFYEFSLKMNLILNGDKLSAVRLVIN